MLGCPIAPESAGAERVAELLAPSLATLCAQEEPFAIEGVVIGLAAPARGDTLRHLARTVREVLFALAERDADADACLAAAIGEPDWWFRFAGVDLLLLTFAPCYDVAHPRCSFGPMTFLLFQPHAVFARRRPQGSEHFPRHTKLMIRRAFERAGRGYDVHLSASPIESHKFVKPLAVGDPPVEWWCQDDE